jgi:hypothetical protein
VNHAHDTYCSFCRRQPCRCDVDAGDERADEGDAGDLEIDVYAVLRRDEARDRAGHWLRPNRPLDS